MLLFGTPWPGQSEYGFFKFSRRKSPNWVAKHKFMLSELVDVGPFAFDMVRAYLCEVLNASRECYVLYIRGGLFMVVMVWQGSGSMKHFLRVIELFAMTMAIILLYVENLFRGFWFFGSLVLV